ncbi:MAG: ABC transporter permease subunit [Oscillospiraceae bacterium]
MVAILKRELRAYCRTPVGYAYIAVFYFFAGLYFMTMTLLANTTDLSGVFSGMFNICIFILPILTMGLFSEERRNKTDQALFTAPVGITCVVLGKFFAALSIFFIGACITLLFGGVVDIFSAPSWPVIAGSFIGLILLGSALISIGIFISSLTESQMVSAVGTFATGLFLVLSDGIDSLFSFLPLKYFLRSLSFNSHYRPFTLGIVSVSDVLFFLSVTAVFLLFTVRVIEHRRWN